MINSDNSKTIKDRLKHARILANTHVGQNTGEGEPVSRSGSVEHITPEFSAAAARLLRSGVTYFFRIRSMGGAIADVPVEATAFGSRSANFEVTAGGTSRERLDESWDNMQRFFCGLYYSFDTDPRPERVRSAFPPSTLERLRALKLHYALATSFANDTGSTCRCSGSPVGARRFHGRLSRQAGPLDSGLIDLHPCTNPTCRGTFRHSPAHAWMPSPRKAWAVTSRSGVPSRSRTTTSTGRHTTWMRGGETPSRGSRSSRSSDRSREPWNALAPYASGSGVMW